MRQELTDLADNYQKAGDAIHDVIRNSIRSAGGFLNCTNNDGRKKDMHVLVYDSKKKYSERFPIRAMKVDAQGTVQVYAGTEGTVYTEKYLRGILSEEHWMPLKGSNVLFQPTILSIAAAIDDYLSA
ncbi:MAG: hypothetical protein K5849_05165 [Bacteroidales bacterium]|nr:hypothetical protein [Bacteroidales bacterium]